jgi:hypothetical protein
MTVAGDSYLRKGGNSSIVLSTEVSSQGSLITNTYNLWITSFSTSAQTQFSNSQTQKGIVWVPIRRSEMMITFSVDWPLQTNGSTIEGEYDYNGFRAMHEFHNNLRKHQKLSATTGSTPPPMNFTYFNNYYSTKTTSNSTSLDLTSTNSSPYSTSKNNSLVDNNLSRILDYTQLINTATGPDYKARNPVQSNLQLQPLQYQGWILQVSKQYDRFKAVYSVQYVMSVLNPSNGNTDMPASIVVRGNVPQLLPTTSTVLQQGQNWTKANITMGNGINVNGIPG